MKKPYAFEAMAAAFGIAGALLLVSGLMPFINPGFVDVRATGEYSPRMAFLLPTLLSLPLLGLSWHFNKQARGIRKEFEKPQRVVKTPIQRKLKWIIFGSLILLLLLAFFW